MISILDHRPPASYICMVFYFAQFRLPVADSQADSQADRQLQRQGYRQGAEEKGQIDRQRGRQITTRRVYRQGDRRKK